MTREPEATHRREAHAAANEKAPSTEMLLLDELRAAPGAGSNLAVRLGITILTVRPTLCRLRDAGKIEPTGEHFVNGNGRKETIYQISKERKHDDQPDLFAGARAGR